MKILLVLTSHDQLGDTGQKTGFWLEEFTSPYYVFKDAGAEVVLASPKGGQPPLDPHSSNLHIRFLLSKSMLPILMACFIQADMAHSGI